MIVKTELSWYLSIHTSKHHKIHSPMHWTLFKGALVGFVAGATGTLVNGGSIGSALKNGIIGGVFGAVTAGFANGIGDISNFGIRALAHGASSSFMTRARGGRWSSGFWSGFVGTMLSPVAGAAKGFYGKLAANAIVAGTISQVTGGKFANGAWSGAFQYMFNHAMHDVANFSAGFADAISFGGISKLRQYLGWDDNVDYDSGYYTAGEVGSMTLGGARLAYAGLAKGASLMSGLTARQTFEFRNSLKKVFRLNPFSTYRIYPYEKMLSKYGSEAAVKVAAGRTNTTINIMGGVGFTGGITNNQR